MRRWLLLMEVLIVGGLVVGSAALYATENPSLGKGIPLFNLPGYPAFQPANPSFVNGRANISFPQDYTVLANYVLSLINNDRAAFGASPLSLSTVASAQQHADSMDYYGTVGHWDVQGYKPYMRYTLLNGTGYMAENVAPGYCTNSPPSPLFAHAPTSCNLRTIENALADSEYEMMNYDATCCNNGHRNNIISSSHNRVSVGIAYNSTSYAVYLVEDFEDNHISSESLRVSAGTVTFQGSTSQDLQNAFYMPPECNPSTCFENGASNATYYDPPSIAIYYDPPPSNISTSELTQSTSCNQYNELSEPAPCLYHGSYNPGTLVASVLAPCNTGNPVWEQVPCTTGTQTCGWVPNPRIQPGNTTWGGNSCTYSAALFAQTWQQSSGNFKIVFSISALESTYGSGVYTLYLYPLGDTSDPITSLSLFVTNT